MQEREVIRKTATALDRQYEKVITRLNIRTTLKLTYNQNNVGLVNLFASIAAKRLVSRIDGNDDYDDSASL